MIENDKLSCTALQRVEHSSESLKDICIYVVLLYKQNKTASLQKRWSAHLQIPSLSSPHLHLSNQSKQVASFIFAPVCGGAFMLIFCLHISSDWIEGLHIV